MTWLLPVGALAGTVAGVAMWRWLRTGRYRLADDEPRLALRHAWVAVPGAAAAGALAGLLQGRPWLAAAAWCYLVGAVPLAWIDLDVHRIPDAILRWWGATLAVLVGVAAVVAGEPALFGTAVAGAAAMGMFFLVLALVGSMGLGDVKLAAATGLMLGALGWAAVIGGVAAAFAAAAGAGVVLLLRGATRGTHVAFGPAIIVGAAAAIARYAVN